MGFTEDVKATNETEVIAEWARLLTSLKADIDPAGPFADGDGEDIPALDVTFGVTVCDDGNLSWGYQTGDNSFTGGAYGHPYWGVVYLTRDADVMEIARAAMEECMEGVTVFGEQSEVDALRSTVYADGKLVENIPTEAREAIAREIADGAAVGSVVVSGVTYSWD
jgi:hypothetical protein